MTNPSEPTGQQPEGGTVESAAIVWSVEYAKQHEKQYYVNTYDLRMAFIAGAAQLRAEVELYLTRMADQEATIRELSELKESWKKRIAELEAALENIINRYTLVCQEAGIIADEVPSIERAKAALL